MRGELKQGGGFGFLGKSRDRRGRKAYALVVHGCLCLLPMTQTVHMRTRDKSKTICVNCDVVNKDKKKQEKKEEDTAAKPASTQQRGTTTVRGGCMCMYVNVSACV